MVDVNKAVQILNEALEADPKAIDALLQLCVPVNSILALHPTIQVYDRTCTKEFCVLRLLGLLNGIFYPQCIFSKYDEQKRLIGFTIVDVNI